MFIKGVPETSKEGKETQTGLVAASATRDGELKTTSTGKEVGSVSVRAMSRKDGSAVFLTVKGWGHFARQISRVNKGDSVLAAGRLESREYNGNTYTDLVCDFFIAPGRDVPGSQESTAADGGFSLLGEDEVELPF